MQIPSSTVAFTISAQRKCFLICYPPLLSPFFFVQIVSQVVAWSTCSPVLVPPETLSLLSSPFPSYPLLFSPFLSFPLLSPPVFPSYFSKRYQADVASERLSSASRLLKEKQNINHDARL